MIGVHAAGIDHSYKKINKTAAACLVCGKISECQIVKYEKSFHIFFMKMKVLEEQFWFDWEKCNHRAVLFDKQDVDRYKQEQVETGFLAVPYYQNMKIQKMATPKKVPWTHILLVLIVSVIFSVFVLALLDRLGISFIP